MARELDDAILVLRTNHTNVGLWIVKTRGDAQAVLASDAALLAHQEHWFVREVLGMVRRTFARLEVSSRSIYALVEPDSCFAGSLLELALAADRVYMLADSDARRDPVRHQLWQPAGRQRSVAAGGSLLPGRRGNRVALRARVGTPLDAREAERLGLVTSAPDDLDWDDEVRVAIEARVALSPDALTGPGGEPAVRPARNDGLAHLRPSVRVAELDLHPSRTPSDPSRRPQGLRHGPASPVRSGARVSHIGREHHQLLGPDPEQRRSRE